MARFLRVSGKADGSLLTEEHITVIAGCFDLVSTEGVPLEMVIEELNKHDMVVDWPDYILAATGAGQNLRSMRNKIIMANGEVFGPVYRKGFEDRLNSLLDGI